MSCPNVAIYVVQTDYGFYNICHGCRLNGHMQAVVVADTDNESCQCEHISHVPPQEEESPQARLGLNPTRKRVELHYVNSGDRYKFHWSRWEINRVVKALTTMNVAFELTLLEEEPNDRRASVASV